MAENPLPGGDRLRGSAPPRRRASRDRSGPRPAAPAACPDANVRHAMDAERVRAQLDRILASAAFAGAERARTFLRFVVERVLAGRAAEIKEVVIAVEALGRPPSFDPKADPIVRVEAGRLRDRLRTYYGAEGEADVLLIDLPKGGYVPRFTERRPAVPSFAANVLRLHVLPPNGTAFDAFAVSPDGRHLTFTALLNGTPMLWV